MTLPALLLLGALASGEEGTEPKPLDLSFSVAAEEEACPPVDEVPAHDVAARSRVVARVTFADEIDFAAHVERTSGATLFALGRAVDAAEAVVRGGGRSDLAPGALVRVVGKGGPDGTVRAESVTILPPPGAEKWRELKPELDEFERKYWKDIRPYDDTALARYLDGILARLTPAYVPDGERRFRLLVARDPDLNAFALPDGTIVVHTGLIARMESEAQLASVLAHEMAHVTQRHTLRAMDKDTEHKIVGWGSLLASVLLGATGKGEAAQGMQLMSSAWLSGYSRAHEDEADQVGLRYLYLAGYDVREAPRVWSTFRLLYGDPREEDNFFYGSHSTGRNREHALAREIWKSYEPSGLVGGRIGREDYLRATAAVVRENALLDLKRGNLAWADWGIAKSLAVAPDDAETHVAAGKVAAKRGADHDLAMAIDAFRHATTLDPDAPSAWRELGLALERSGDRTGARQALERFLALIPDGPEAAAVRRRLARI